MQAAPTARSEAPMNAVDSLFFVIPTLLAVSYWFASFAA